jgi:hypothetical protein
MFKNISDINEVHVLHFSLIQIIFDLCIMDSIYTRICIYKKESNGGYLNVTIKMVMRC